MTTDHDFDRLARAWLELGPNEAPERTVAAILQATETLPQARRRFRWPTWRDFTMSRSPLFIGVWATVLIAVAGVALLNRPDQRSLGTPVSSPSSVANEPPASAVAAAALDPRLVGQWIGDHRPILEIPLGEGTRLIFTDVGATYLTPAGHPTDNYLTSGASTTQGTLRLAADSQPNNGCALGDVGTYTWSVSASGRVLHVEATDDACIPRIASVVGTWWRIGCRDVNDGCLGDLDAGTYRSAFTTFHEHLPNQALITYGNLTYTVPDGWSNSGDWDSLFALEPSARIANSTSGDQPHRLVLVLAHPTVARQDVACSAADEPGIEQTAAGMIRAITRLPGVTASTPTPISINLRRGQMVDLSLSPSWTGICPDMDGARSAPVLHQSGSGEQGWASRIAAPDRARLIILELGGGNLAAIAIIDRDSQASFNELAAAAMPIVRSMQFR